MPIKVKKVDLEIDENTEAHHTDQYEITDIDDDAPNHVPDLVVRRGQPFNVTLKLSRDFNEETDVLKIVFETCKFAILLVYPLGGVLKRYREVFRRCGITDSYKVDVGL